MKNKREFEKILNNIKNSFILVVIFFAILIISFENAVAFTATVSTGAVCTFSPDPDTICSPTTNCTGYGYCTTGWVKESTCTPPGPSTNEYRRCLNGTKNCSCSSVNYSSWSACIGGTQTRTIISKTPSDCLICSPVLSQSCSETCTGFTYSDWSACVGGTQTRTVLISSPSGCTGGSPILSQSCCVSHDSYKCYSSDLYWYNSCNVREDKRNECGSSYCDTGGDVDLYCNSGNVWGRYDFRIRGCSGTACTSIWNENSCGEIMIEDCSIRPVDCGYESCADNEKPVWGCAGGTCSYSCIDNAGCVTPTPTPIQTPIPTIVITANIDKPETDEDKNNGDSVLFIGSGTTSRGAIDKYYWRWSNCSNGTILSTNPSVLHFFNSVGSYVIYLTVENDILGTDGRGDISTNCPSRTITVGSAPTLTPTITPTLTPTPRPFRCLNNPTDPIPSSGSYTLCPGDDLGLTKDTFNTLTDVCSFPVGSEPKCQYICNSGTKPSPTPTSTPRCLGNAPDNATSCSGFDEKKPISSIYYRAVTRCTDSLKCEYLCKSGFVPNKTRNDCVRPNCTGEGC